jgi:outer membrane protein OmpA-like peptidoglycan-associated protein
MSLPRVAVAPFAILLLACSSPEPKSPDVGLTLPIHPPTLPEPAPAPPTAELEVTYSIHVDDLVRSVCQGPDPFFDFAATRTTTVDQATMNVLASCMKAGPLREREILLVGRADPRGTSTYNLALGLARADKVKTYLIAAGVDGKRIHTSSLGKDDASPLPADWAGDRRVEVQLAP